MRDDWMCSMACSWQKKYSGIWQHAGGYQIQCWSAMKPWQRFPLQLDFSLLQLGFVVATNIACSSIAAVTTIAAPAHLPPAESWQFHAGCAYDELFIYRALKSEGVCESVLYGLPFIIKPTSCWQLDWDELELNQHSFHALCHSLLVSVKIAVSEGGIATERNCWCMSSRVFQACTRKYVSKCMASSHVPGLGL